MKIYNYEGKEEKEIKTNALLELKLNDEDVFLKFYDDEETGLFKNKKKLLKVLPKKEVLDYAKKIIKEILDLMEIDVRIEGQIREKYLKLNLFTNNNAIIIGKHGQTINSLQRIVRQAIYIKTDFFINLILDVEDYNERRFSNLERMAKDAVRDVTKLKREVKLEPMNAYERRIIHNFLTDNKKIKTVSEGEEPTRSVVIKPVK